MTELRHLPPAAEVAIIGGGFAGMATAWWLARRGVTGVVVLEREAALGQHASGRSAGLGRQLADDDATSALTVRGAAFLRRPPAAFAADLASTAAGPVWAPTGGVLSFDDAEHAAVYVERARRYEVEATALPIAELVARWPILRGLRAAAALHVPGDGVIDVVALMAAYTAGARRGGVQVATGVDVLGLAPSGGRVTVETRQGALQARIVVDASGAWAGALTADAPLAALKRHVYVLAADAPAPDAPYVWHVGRAELYVRPAADGLLASACDATISAQPVPAGGAQLDGGAEAMLRERLGDAAPEVAGAHVTRAWACWRSFTPDHRMRLGRDPRRPWLVWSAGLGGHGATASAAVGEIVATAVADALEL